MSDLMDSMQYGTSRKLLNLAVIHKSTLSEWAAEHRFTLKEDIDQSHYTSYEYNAVHTYCRSEEIYSD